MYCSVLQRNLLISTYPTEVFCTCGPQLYSFFTPCKFFSTKYGHVSYLLIISSLLLAITSQLAMTASSLQLDLAVSVLYSIQVLLNQLWLCQLFTPCQFYSTNYYFFQFFTPFQFSSTSYGCPSSLLHSRAMPTHPLLHSLPKGRVPLQDSLDVSVPHHLDPLNTWNTPVLAATLQSATINISNLHQHPSQLDCSPCSPILWSFTSPFSTLGSTSEWAASTSSSSST